MNHAGSFDFLNKYLPFRKWLPEVLRIVFLKSSKPFQGHRVPKPPGFLINLLPKKMIKR